MGERTRVKLMSVLTGNVLAFHPLEVSLCMGYLSTRDTSGRCKTGQRIRRGESTLSASWALGRLAYTFLSLQDPYTELLDQHSLSEPSVHQLWGFETEDLEMWNLVSTRPFSGGNKNISRPARYGEQGMRFPAVGNTLLEVCPCGLLEPRNRAITRLGMCQ